MLVLALLLAGSPVLAQQPLPPADGVPTLYFSKDPNPVPPPPVPVPPQASKPADPPAEPQKSSVRFLPRALFLRKDTPQIPPASLEFTKEAQAAPGVAPAAAPPTMHFTKDAAPAPVPAPAAPAPTMHFTKNTGPTLPPAPAPINPPPALHFQKEAPQSSAGRLPLGNEIPPHQLPVMQVAMQAQPVPGQLPPEEEVYAIQLIPPGPQRVFRLESEGDFQERMRQEARQRGQRIDFPPEPVVSTENFQGRNYPPAAEVVEPAYVCYKRLYFEERNAERYDWDLGIMQPLVSLGYFYKDVLLFPYHAFTDPCRCFDCDAGYCLPGDPMPYLLYPPKISVTGAIAEAAAVFTILAILPG